MFMFVNSTRKNNLWLVCRVHSLFPVCAVNDLLQVYCLSPVSVCVEVLRPSQPNGVMSSVVSLPNHIFTGRAWSSKRLNSIVYILSPETDNSPSWISRRERMTVENISWSNLHERMLPTRSGLNPQLTSWSPVRRASNWATEAGLSPVWFVTSVFCILFAPVCAMNGLWLMCMVYCLSPVWAMNGFWLVYMVYMFVTSLWNEWFVTSIYGVLFVTSMCNEWFVTSIYGILFASICAMNGSWLVYFCHQYMQWMVCDFYIRCIVCHQYVQWMVCYYCILCIVFHGPHNTIKVMSSQSVNLVF